MKYIGVIIDFGKSHFKYEGKNYGYYGDERIGVSSDKMYPLHDAYKLLCYCLYILYKYDIKKFKIIAPILEFFNKMETAEEIILKQRSYYYSLPRNTIFDDKSILELTKFIRNNYQISNFDNKPTGIVLNCDHNLECQSQQNLLQILNQENYPKDIIELGVYMMGLSPEQIMNQYQELKKAYIDYKPEAMTENAKLKKEIFDLRIWINSNLMFINIISRSKIDILISENFIEKYKTYLYNIVKLSQAILEYHDIISAMEYIIRIRLKSTDDYLNFELENDKKFNKYLENFSKLLLIDIKKIPQELIFYLESGGALEYVKNFYQKELPTLVDAISNFE